MPFYQMVFKGVVPIAVSPLNTASDVRTQFLQAMESGSALSFVLCDTWQSAFSESANDVLRYGIYDVWKDEIVALTAEATPLLSAVAGTTVKEHTIRSKDIHKTVFSNGVTVYVNYAEKAADTPAGSVPAKGFIFEESEGGI